MIDPDKIYTVEEFVGEGEEADWGALNIFKLANSLIGASSYEPVSGARLEKARVFAAETAFYVEVEEEEVP